MKVILALLLCSSSAFAADWQCGKFIAGNEPHLQLDANGYYKYQLLAVNESTDDFVSSFKGERACVKGHQILGSRALLAVYDIKAE